MPKRNLRREPRRSSPVQVVFPSIGIFFPTPRTIGSSTLFLDKAELPPERHSSDPGTGHSRVGGAAMPVPALPAHNKGSLGCICGVMARNRSITEYRFRQQDRCPGCRRRGRGAR